MMSAMKKINVDADPKNANWPKRTKDVTDYPIAVTNTVVTTSKTVADAAKKVRTKRKGK